MTRKLKQIVGIIVVIALVVILGIAGVILYDSQAGTSAADVTNMTFTASDGTQVGAFLAQPDGEGPFPAVLMVHEWWGLTAEATEMARLLAAEGYVVLAPDTYRGKVAETVPGAISLRITAPKDRVDSDMQAAFAYLAALPNVDATRIGVLGFCYGGGVALRHAIQNPQIAATVNLYGEVVEDAANFGALLQTKTPVLGIFGDADQQIPPEEAHAFEAALDAAAIPNSVTLYADMPHAFVSPHSIETEGEPRRAWQDILAFLAEHLQNTPA